MLINAPKVSTDEMKHPEAGAAPETNETVIINVLQVQPKLEFAVLVGSQADGTSSIESDWDIALQWSPRLNWLDRLGNIETLRRQLAKCIGVDETLIDLIDLSRANLAMRASVAEEGKSLKGEDGLAWAYFLQRTWQEIEDFNWGKHHAA